MGAVCDRTQMYVSYGNKQGSSLMPHGAAPGAGSSSSEDQNTINVAQSVPDILSIATNSIATVCIMQMWLALTS